MRLFPIKTSFYSRCFLLFLAAANLLGVAPAFGEEIFLKEVTRGAGSKSSAKFELSLENFRFDVLNRSGSKIDVMWQVDSIEWIRVQSALVLPRAIMRIVVRNHAEDMIIKYGSQSITFTRLNETESYAKFFYSLLHSEPIRIFHAGKEVAIVNVWKKIPSNAQPRQYHHADYSCASYDIEITQLDYEYLSYGCFTEQVGRFNSQKNVLHLLWVASNVRSESDTTPAYHLQFFESGEKQFLVKVNNQERVVKISSKFNHRANRLFVGMGLGPYKFQTAENERLADNQFAPALMFYLNYRLTEKSSARVFDAALWRGTYFNNLGVYFGYEAVKVFDNRIDITGLFGFQAVTFKYDAADARLMHEYIFPQGFEVNYRHAFGWKNYTLGFGVFISPVDDNPYVNMWLRFGPKVFGELNWISWQKGKQKADMYGISVVFPIGYYF